MEARKLLIADSNEDFRLALAQALQKHYSVRCCATGMEAYALLCKETPDILVLDMMLPELDGLALLERMTAQGIRPMVLVISSCSANYIGDAASRLGISYVILKPCQVQAVVDRVRDMNTWLNVIAAKPDPNTTACRILSELGISTKYGGHDCITAAMILLNVNSKMAITKELYPAVAKICNCKHNHVERNIRSAIEATWSRRNPEVWDRYFPGFVDRPSNGAFLRTMVKVLQERLE